MTFIRLTLVLVAGLSLTACANRSLEDLRHTPMKGSLYQSFLASKYLEYAEAEEKAGDWDDAAYFAEKGLQAAYGNDVEPEDVTRWGLSEANLQSLTVIRAEILAMLTPENQEHKSQAAAEAVFYYDCVVDQLQEEQLTEAAFCHERLMEAMEYLKQVGYGTEDAQEPAETATPPSPEKPVQKNYLVYFGLDQDQLDETTQRVVEAVFKELQNLPNVQIALNGHTDTSGPNRYNLDLSQRRANTVKKALIGLGIAAERIINFGFGETDLAVPTPDNTYEPKNRRVEIVVN